MAEDKTTSRIRSDFLERDKFVQEIEAMHAKWKHDWGWGTASSDMGSPYSVDDLMVQISELINHGA